MANNVWRPLPPLSPSDIERFWIKVDRRGPDECWPWTAALHHGGYGVFQIRNRAFVSTHVALAISGRDRPQPPRHHALHSCDNRACVNPAHLRWGSHNENVTDMVERGRSMAGERSPHTTFTEEQVREIRGSWLSLKELALVYGVSKSAIAHIKAGRSWRCAT